MSKRKPKFQHPKKISFSTEGAFAQTISCFPAFGKRPAKIKYISEHNLSLGWINERYSSPRAFIPVCVRMIGLMRIYLMDAVTGTLYCARTGECLSSKVNRLVRFSNKPKDAATAKELLMAIVPAAVNGGVW